MTAEENKAIFVRFVKELGKGNLAVIDEVCAPDFAFHSPNFPNWPRGLEGAGTLAVAGRDLFTDALYTDYIRPIAIVTAGGIEDFFRMDHWLP